jgi:hypothetical protein
MFVGDGALEVDLDASVDNMPDWKGVQDRSGEVNSTKAYIKIMRFSVAFSAGVAVVYH